MANHDDPPVENENQSVTLWLQKIKDGDSVATQQIWERYYSRLVEIARSKLKANLRRVSDEEDVALDALNSLFQGVSAGRFPSLNDRNDLWRLLFTITDRKAMATAKFHSRQKRGKGEVRGNSIFEGPVGSHGGAKGLEAECPMPTPEAAAELTESMRELLNQLEDRQLVEIAIKKLEGYSVEDIAQSMDCSVRTVKRKLQRIRTVWSEPSIHGQFGIEKSEAD